MNHNTIQFYLNEVYWMCTLYEVPRLCVNNDSPWAQASHNAFRRTWHTCKKQLTIAWQTISGNIQVSTKKDDTRQRSWWMIRSNQFFLWKTSITLEDNNRIKNEMKINVSLFVLLMKPLDKKSQYYDIGYLLMFHLFSWNVYKIGPSQLYKWHL